MEMRVQCPGCKLALKVPANSAGKYARCPSCRTKFAIPKMGDLVEDTISSWIEEDVDKERDERADEIDHNKRPSAEPQPGHKPVQDPRAEIGLSTTPMARRAEPPQRVPPRPSPPGAPGNTPAPEPNVPSARRPAVAKPPGSPPASPSDSGMPELDEPKPATSRPDAPARTPEPEPSESADERQPNATAPPSNASAPALVPQEAADFPQDLFPSSARPYLVIKSCSQEGVAVTFDANWLEHAGFQLSLPVRCVFSGASERAELIARPMAFVDRSQAAVRSAREIEARYESPLSGGQTAHQLLQLMGKLEWLKPPFNSPVPYYVSQHHTRSALKCSTRARPGGGITCDVLIPDVRYAMEWVANVNGICGPEYRLLERASGLMWNEAWRRLTEEARERLSQWVNFEAMETFRAYLPDADFGKADFGLAGLVLTDRRLVFCKLRRRGSIPLTDQGTLHVETEGDFAHISHGTEAGRTKLVKLHLADLPSIIKALAGAAGLKLQVG